ncbi:MAG: hypothetical protein L7T23_01295 [Alphaproteobacteria bacterium]|nr:hypothetical protein [Alphaproteobacteria bacterium]
MELNDKEIELKLCETYFSILSKTSTYNITLDELCVASKISYEKAKKIIPTNFNEDFFFLKLFISKVDSEVLEELKNEIQDDDVSTIYDKILEGITLRFEKFLKNKTAIQILSHDLDKRINIFFKLLKENYSFMINLLKLVEENQNCFLQNIKSVALNFVFIKGLEKFLEDEAQDVDTTVRFIDKYLTEIEDFGFLIGFLKKES